MFFNHYNSYHKFIFLNPSTSKVNYFHFVTTAVRTGNFSKNIKKVDKMLIANFQNRDSYLILIVISFLNKTRVISHNY